MSLEDLSQVVTCNGRYWYNTANRQHRDNGLPAVKFADGGREWWINNRVHRDGDLPAVVLTNGTRYWYNKGQHHRDGGLPAMEYAAIRYWYVHGLLHRDGGLPAIEFADGKCEWWVNGIRQPGGCKNTYYSDMTV